jgi:micrococcal nuclease
MYKFIKKYKIKIALIMLIVAFCSVATYLSAPTKFSYKNIPKIEPEKEYRVERVLDGDTFEIKVDQKLVTIRMLGIDTPETVDPRKPAQCFGKEASDNTKKILEGQPVKLKIDKTKTFLDKYGRVLAYVYLEDGLFLNELLLGEGYAREYTYGKPYLLKKQFKKLEKEASKNKRGLWGEPCNGKTT